MKRRSHSVFCLSPHYSSLERRRIDVKSSNAGPSVLYPAALLGFLLIAAPANAASPGEVPNAKANTASVKENKTAVTFTLTAVEANGTKFWLPSTIIVKKGAKVELTLVNKLDASHGFAINDLKIKEEVPAASSVKVSFTADKVGVYSYYCQLHAPHIGGQILVKK
jgi:nitrosocyanin